MDVKCKRWSKNEIDSLMTIKPVNPKAGIYQKQVRLAIKKVAKELKRNYSSVYQKYYKIQNNLNKWEGVADSYEYERKLGMVASRKKGKSRIKRKISKSPKNVFDTKNQRVRVTKNAVFITNFSKIVVSDNNLKITY